MARKSAYAQAGVDLELGNQVKQTLPDLLASTHRKEVLGKVGGFGGLFAAGFKELQKACSCFQRGWCRDQAQSGIHDW